MHRQTIWPCTAPCDWRDFAESNADRTGWRVIRHLAAYFPEWVSLDTTYTQHWRAAGGTRCILIDAGYQWDGASGPALDTSDAIVASLIHDIICTRVDGRCCVPSYMQRHRIYRTIARVNGMPPWRAWGHWTGLVLANWAWADPQEVTTP